MQHATGELENTAGLQPPQARPRARPHRGAPARHRLQRDRDDRHRRREEEKMADEDKTPETEETPDSVQEEVETAASEEGAGDTSTVDAPERGAAGGGPAPAAEAAPAEPQEVLAPKERRARSRAAQEACRRGPQTPEQRDAERPPPAPQGQAAPPYRQREKTKAAEQRAAAADARARRRARARPRPRQGAPGHRRLRQGRQDDRRARRRHPPPPALREDHAHLVKLHAHDERNDAGTGDTVRVVECRPMSRTKRWRLTDVAREGEVRDPERDHA